MTEQLVAIEREFEVELGDGRREQRLSQLAAQMSVDPSKSFPTALTSAELEGAYRLFNNRAVTLQQVIAGHRRESAERIGAYDEVIVAHDTSEFRFSGEKRRDLGSLGTAGQGFLAHVSLAIAVGERNPLGVVHVETWTRKGKSVSKKRNEGELTRKQAALSPERESLRWHRGVDEVEALLATKASVIHVMDSESDDYALLSKLISEGRRFVIRLGCDRVAIDDGVQTKVRELAKKTTAKLEREVYVSPRKRPVGGNKDKRRSAREARMASLTLSACPLSIRRPDRLSNADAPKVLALNLVSIREQSPPEGAEAIEWLLLTTEAIDTIDQLCRVVDVYRQRWMIEEYFKALKTGCSIEARQLESLDALLNMFGLFVPIAWSLLRVRAAARSSNPPPASTVLTELQIRILQRHERSKLTSDDPTARDALLAIAALGGHIKNNGEPGWLVLSRGFTTLLGLEAGVRLAAEM